MMKKVISRLLNVFSILLISACIFISKCKHAETIPLLIFIAFLWMNILVVFRVFKRALKSGLNMALKQTEGALRLVSCVDLTIFLVLVTYTCYWFCVIMPTPGINILSTLFMIGLTGVWGYWITTSILTVYDTKKTRKCKIIKFPGKRY